MPYVKLASAARRARMGSVTAIRRALVAAGIELVTLAPGEWAVEDSDLDRFLTARLQNPTPAAANKAATTRAEIVGGLAKVKKKRRQ